MDCNLPQKRRKMLRQKIIATFIDSNQKWKENKIPELIDMVIHREFYSDWITKDVTNSGNVSLEYDYIVKNLCKDPTHIVVDGLYCRKNCAVTRIICVNVYKIYSLKKSNIEDKILDISKELPYKKEIMKEIESEESSGESNSESNAELSENDESSEELSEDIIIESNIESSGEETEDTSDHTTDEESEEYQNLYTRNKIRNDSSFETEFIGKLMIYKVDNQCIGYEKQWLNKDNKMETKRHPVCTTIFNSNSNKQRFIRSVWDCNYDFK